MTSRGHALALLVGCSIACTSEHAVFELSEVTTCEAAWTAMSGTACTFAGTCERPDADNPTCCSQSAYCSPNGLHVATVCNPDCSTCVDDRDCTHGAAICTTQLCTACPSTAACPTCPQGWQRLHRNGCETCDCAPPSQCTAPDTMVDNNMSGCQMGEQCYQGERCTAGCAPGDDCCANVCSSVGCSSPAPLGCLQMCQMNMQCQQCVADACECMNGNWLCTPRCVDGQNVPGSCIAN